MYNNKRYNVPINIGRALKDGRVVVTRTSYLPGRVDNIGNRTWIGDTRLFDICRTVFGGRVKTRPDKSYLSPEYMLIPLAGAHLIALYNKMATNYAGLGLQEFLMKTWSKE